MRKLLIAFAALCGSLCTSSDALATPLAAGGVVTPPDALPETSTSVLVSTGSLPFDKFSGSGLKEMKGTLIETVYIEAGGRLDFVYQVTLTVGDIARLTGNAFTGFTVDVSTFPTNTINPLVATGGFAVGTAAPTSADRDPTGSVVGFNFSTPPVAPVTTYVMIIRTNATTTSSNDTNISEGVTVRNADLNNGAGGMTFGPGGSPVPEPSTLLLLGGLTAGMGGARLRRWWKGQPLGR